MGAGALLTAGWLQIWLVFVTGINAGFLLFWVMFDRIYAKQREKMRDEMNAIGADIVRRMHEDYRGMANPYWPPPIAPRDDEPPRMH